MEEPIFYFKKLSQLNIITLLVYTGFSVILFLYSLDLIPKDQQGGLLYYALLTQMFLFIFGYRALRNMTYFCCWLIIALAHLVLYLEIKDNKTLFIHSVSAATGLRNTTILLILFQIVRFISLKIQHQEFVVPGRGTKKDIYEERKVNFLNYLLFLGLMFIMFFLAFH